MRLRFRPLRLLFWGSLSLPVAIVLILASNLLTYARLSHEQEVGEIRFKQLDDGRFLAVLSLPGGEKRYLLDGDQWQLDARVVKWRPWANLFGLDAGYRLERLSGRHSDMGKVKLSAPSSYQLTPAPVIDIWMVAQRHSNWVPLLDAAYGSSVYLPMSDGIAYRVTMSQSGLLARVQQRELNTNDAD